MHAERRDKAQAYLSASRRVKVGVHEPPHYRELMGALQFPGTTVAPPRLLTTYSGERRSELITVDGDTFVVHDLCFSETMMRLNAIVLGSGTLTHAMMYVYQYAAERLCARGLPCLALLPAELSLKLAARAGMPRVELFDLGKLTAIQEFFVIAHEVSHHVLQQDSSYRISSFERVRALFDDFMAGYATPQTLSMASQHLDTEMKLEELEEAAREIVDLWTMHLDESLEEMACDGWSLLAAVGVGRTQLQLPVSQIHVAVLLAFRHLRFIRYANSLIDSWVDGESPNWLDLSLSQMRESVLRHDMYTSHAIFDSEEDWRMINRRLTSTSDRYSMVIDAALLGPLAVDLRQLTEGTPPRSWEVQHSMDVDKEIQMVDSLTGWDSDAANPS